MVTQFVFTVDLFINSGTPYILINMTPSNAAGKLKTCHHYFQVSNVAIHVYPTLQTMQAKFLLLKFQG